MDLNTSDYFSYKKQKIESAPPPKQPRRISKLNFIIQLFVATFIIAFIIIVVAIMKYSSRVDIEFAQGELSLSNSNIQQSNITGYDVDDKQGKIDKKLFLIQQEENAPSEAKIIAKQPENSNVIDAIHLENNNKIEKEVKAENEKNKPNLVIPDKPETGLLGAINEIKNSAKKTAAEIPLPESRNKNITVMSKVLIGKYLSFADAQKYQKDVKAKNPTLTPFVRKVGDIFSIQMGSYADFEVAKKQAQTLKSQGYDVWIYQQ